MSLWQKNGKLVRKMVRSEANRPHDSGNFRVKNSGPVWQSLEQLDARDPQCHPPGNWTGVRG